MSNVVKAVTMVTFDSTSLSGGYDAINGDGFAEPIFRLRIVNDSDANIQISYDGVSSHDFVQDGAVLDLDFNTLANKRDVSYISKGTTIYFKSAAGTGNIYLIGYYLKN